MLAIIRATILEIACDALALLVTLAALALSTFAGALHYHQFGEPARMAREAGLSAIMVGGIVFCIFTTVRTIRRELESHTVEMALAHSVSRTGFLCAKMLGVAFAYLVFFATVLANTITAVRGSVIGAEVAAGGIARVWGPSLALGVAPLVLPLVIAAALNRFCNMRFARTAMFLVTAFAIAGVAYRFDASQAVSVAGVALALIPLALFFIALSGALATAFSANAATALSFAAVVLALPAFGSHYLADAVIRGGAVPWKFIALAYAAALPLVAASVIAGAQIFKQREI